jgi:hypothetical protein
LKRRRENETSQTGKDPIKKNKKRSGKETKHLSALSEVLVEDEKSIQEEATTEGLETVKKEAPKKE